MVGLTEEGVNQAFEWVVVMRNAEEGEKKCGRNHGREREDGDIEAIDTVGATVKWLHASWNVWIKRFLRRDPKVVRHLRHVTI